MLLYGENIKKEYGIQKILEIKKLEIKDRDRIGLTGRNGAGKSTLLGILNGRISSDEGIIKRNGEIAEIRQGGETDGESDGRYLSSMNLRGSAVKSGGEKTRLAIAAAFSKHTPLLFADEPTTSLDLEGIIAFEKMLKGYRGAYVIISHDRELLDRTCNQIWELEEGELRIFDGNYSARAAAKVDGLTVSNGEKVIFKDAELTVQSGKKTFLTGSNGSGKTTLIRQLLERKNNTFITAEAKIGYFSQEQEILDFNKTVFENVRSGAGVPEHIVRAVLMNLYMKEKGLRSQHCNKKLSFLMDRVVL